MLDEVQPNLSIALQVFQNRWRLNRDVALLRRLLSDQTAGRVHKLQVIIQRHRQTTLIAGTMTRRLFANFFSWRFKFTLQFCIGLPKAYISSKRRVVRSILAVA